MADIDLNIIDDAVTRACAAGALQTIRTEQALVEQNGLSFTVRWVSSLAEKDNARLAMASGRNPDFNPFLPPEPALTVGPLGDRHVAILNKFPVIARHLLIVTRAFEEQCSPLTEIDFTALARIMTRLGGLGFYNGGEEAGASQRHKHLQWVPESPQSENFLGMVAALPETLDPMQRTTHPALHWRHGFIRHAPLHGASPETAGVELHRAFALACEACGLHADNSGAMPPYNMLVNDYWMVVIPRRTERFGRISINALGFAGSMFVRQPEDIGIIRRIGPLAMLAAVAKD